MRPSVFVFRSARFEYNGLSLQRNGMNLPLVASETPQRWFYVDEVPMSEHHLRAYAVDGQVALVNLQTRGYHLTRPVSQVLDLPKTHRCAA